VDTNSVLHGVVVVLVGIIGWIVRKMDAQIKDLDLRAQVSDVRWTRSDEQSATQAKAIEKFQEDITDIREHMVRRADLEAL
jgi:hypothetical protein